MPFTLIPEEPSAPAGSRFTVVNEPSQESSTDPRESFAAGMAYPLEEPLAMGSGAINYALHGGAPGSYESGVQDFHNRLNTKWNDNPKTAAAGMGTSIGLGIASGGSVSLAGLRAGTRPLAAALAKGGQIAEKVSEPAGMISGSKHLEMALKYGGRASRYGAERMRGNPEGARQLLHELAKEKLPKPFSDRFTAEPPTGFQGTGNPFSGPAPNASIRGLSPEMQAKSDAYQAFLRRHSLNQ